MQDRKERFRDVFLQNSWGDDESRSGSGSRLNSHSVLTSIKVLRNFISNNQIKSMIDCPCGDFNWMPFIMGCHDIDYCGIDIVPEIIEQNRLQFPQYKFLNLDAVNTPPPSADLIFCKDLVNHLSNADVANLLRNFKLSKSRFVIISNNAGHTNKDIPENSGGSSRYLDLFTAPFSFPPAIIDFGYLAAWSFDQIPIEFFDDLCLSMP